MKALLLLALATFGQCALLGSEKCTYGPSYWCSHVGHAKECGAMEHCMATVWKNQQVDMIGSTETCFDAIKVLDVVRHVSDFDLKEQWIMGCTGMPFGKRQLCKGLIRTNVHEVSMLLKSDLSSRQIAAALNLCGGFADTASHSEVKQVTGDYCTDCVNFMGDLRQIFNNSVEQLKDMIKSTLCTRLSSLTDVCDDLVDAYGNVVFNLIYQELNPQDICQILHMCANQTHAEVMKSLQYMLAQRKLNGAVCDVCKDVAQVIDDALKSTDFQNEVKAELENEVCPLLGSFAAQCKSYVEQYAPLLFQIAIAEMDPDTFCQTVGLCNATKSDKQKMTHVPLASPVGTVRILAPERDSSNGLECDLCEEIVKKFKEAIDGKTAEEAKECLEKLCKDLPNEISGVCTSLVDQYADQIIQLLLNDVDPQKVCELIGECSGAKVLTAVALTAAVKGTEECKVCSMVLTEVKKELNSTVAKTLEKEVLDKICTIAGDYKAACQLFVDHYYPAIANMIAEKVDPAKLCSIVKLCGPAAEAQKGGSSLKFQPMMTLRPAAKHYVLGANKCLFGPSFWCATEDNMKMCKAEKACMMVREKEMKRQNKINA